MEKELREELKKLRELLERSLEQNAYLQAENKILRQKVDALIARLFGRKSEKLDPNQLELLMGLLDTEDSTDPDEDPSPDTPSGKRRKPRKNKPRMPVDLPTVEIRLDPDAVKENPEQYKRIGEEITQELDVTPAQYFCRKIIRGKYVKKNDKSVAPIIAPLPERMIEGGYASPGIIADIVVKKYNHHLPLYRQEQILKTCHDIELSRKVMADWVKTAADWLGPIYRLMKEDFQKRKYLQVDETPIKYNDKDSPVPGSKQGYFWAYNDPVNNEVLFEWHTSRAADCLDDILSKFKGTVQCDAYQAYISYARKNEGIELAGCFAHARRKFHEARTENPKVAGWFLKQIQALYQVEAYLRMIGAEEQQRLAYRQGNSKWILVLLKKALREKMAVYLPKSQMGKAVHYSLANWDKLIKFCDNGLLEIDNNGVENAIRPTAIGKKNWLFIGHPQAGERSAILYTILENCKRLGINPQEYLKDVLSRLPSMKITEVRELLPATWLGRRKEEAA